MKKLFVIFAISLVILSAILSGCQTANRVPGVSAAKSAVASMVPPSTPLTTIMPTATVTMPAATITKPLTTTAMPTATVSKLATATPK